MAKRSRVTWAFLAIVSLLAAWALVPRTVARDASTPPAAGPSTSSSLVALEDLVVDPASAALLGGMPAGSVVTGEWRLVAVSPVREGAIKIALERNREVAMSVWIGRKGEGKRPPFETSRYAITYGDVRPVGRPVPDSEQSDVAKAIEAKVRENEAVAPTPPGL